MAETRVIVVGNEKGGAGKSTIAVHLVTALLYGGADLTILSDDGKMPLDLALEEGHSEAAKILQEGITKQFKPRRE